MGTDELLQKMLDLDLNGREVGNGLKFVGLKDLKPLDTILDLTGKVAIVSGGARGLGARIVSRLCEGGASCVIADIADEFAEQDIAFFNTKNYKVKYCKTDVCDINQIYAAVDFTVKEFGKVDILVYNTTRYGFVAFSDITEEIWDTSVDTGLKGAFFFIQAVAKQMIKQGHGGRIVTISSNAGNSMENFYGYLIPYVASKSGLNGITKSLARELKPHKIRINAVVPGGMMTVSAMNFKMTPEIQAAKDASPTAPVGDPDEIARMVYILSTEMSDYMDGSIVHVDGGTYLGFNK
jgi:NAD(P)-dependent dehydrogenase (short-subunit alcohol dehydrogenase family)